MYLQACGDVGRRNGHHGDIGHGRTGKKKKRKVISLLCNGENYNASQLCVRKPGDGRRLKTVPFVRLV